MKNRIVIISLFFSLLFKSCGVYLPQSADIALINKKNDLRIDAGVASSLTSGNTTISYGLTEKITLQGYGTIASNGRHYYQGAMGYYKNLENRNVLEIYVGVGNGYGYSNNHDEPSTISGNYQVYYSQINYGKLGGNKSIWDFAFGVKTGILHTDLTKEITDNQFTVITESYVGNSFMVEPTGIIRVGGKHLKFNLKLSGVYIHKAYGAGLSYFPLNLGASLNYRL